MFCRLFAGVFLAALVSTGCCCFRTTGVPVEDAQANDPFGMVMATTPMPRHRMVEPVNGWHQRYESKRKQMEAAQNQIDIVLIGDSITHGWDSKKSILRKYFPNCNILNLGHSGDRTENQLWIVKESGFLDAIKPGLVVVMIGTNNLGHRTAGPEATAAGIKLIVENLRSKLPESKILLFGIFPRAEQPDHIFRGQIVEVNNSIKVLADDENIFYVDLADDLLEEDGTLSKKIAHDFLHLTPAGYEIWAKAILPYAERFVMQANK